MTLSSWKQKMHLCSMQPYSTLMAGTCMTYSCTNRKVCMHTDGYHSSSSAARQHLNSFLHLLHVKPGVGDKLVLLADVDKHSATDLLKLLNRYAAFLYILRTSVHSVCRQGLEQCHEQPVLAAPVDQWLCRYKLRAKVDIADVSSEYTTWARFGPGLMPQGKLLHCLQAMSRPHLLCQSYVGCPM